MSNSFSDETSKMAVSHQEETSALRAVLTKQVNAGQQTVDPKEPRNRDGGSCDVITTDASPKVGGGFPVCIAEALHDLDLARLQRTMEPQAAIAHLRAFEEWDRELGRLIDAALSDKPPDTSGTSCNTAEVPEASR